MQDNVETFERKPVRIRALQWTGGNLAEVRAFVGVDTDLNGVDHQKFYAPPPDWAKESCLGRTASAILFLVPTDGWEPVEVGDWILEGHRGHFKLAPECFNENYRKAR